MRTALDGRPLALFPAAASAPLTIKSKRERVFLAVAEVAAERVPGAGVRARSCRRLSWTHGDARAIMPFLFPVEGINVYNASKTRRLKWKTRGRNLICLSRSRNVFRALFNPRSLSGISSRGILLSLRSRYVRAERKNCTLACTGGGRAY